MQDIRTFQSLGSMGDIIMPAGTAQQAVIPMPTYTASVENSYTDTYTTGDVVAAADGEYIRGIVVGLMSPVRVVRHPGFCRGVKHETD